jgi:hypothetical protein
MTPKYYLIAAALFFLAGLITMATRNFGMGATWIASGAAFAALSQRKVT